MAVPELLGFGSQLSAECPKGSNIMCMGFYNGLSRSSTLVDLQDVYYTSKGSLHTNIHSQESEVMGM